MTLLAHIAATLAVFSANSTAYAPCSSGTIMADGTHVRAGSVASNRHPLGTRIYLVGRPTFFGRRHFTVRDRIGYGSDLDFWTASCTAARTWGRRVVHYRLGWRGNLSGRVFTTRAGL
jgi:3D (Asp-Asp-Asp) domain-containing protein